MSVRIDIYVPDIISAVDSGYEQIKVYRSLNKDSDYSEATAASTRLALSSISSRYSYTDIFGGPDTWFKWSFYSATGPIESSLSNALRGVVSGTYYRDHSYPPEVLLSGPEQDMVYRVREYIGDFKEVNRDYLSSTTSYDNVSTDTYSVEFDNPPAWPLSVVVDGTSYQTINDPVVKDYSFITFSGTAIDTTDGTVDIWYDHFRFSDREILSAYNNSELPAGITVAMASAEMYELQASIKLLEAELRNFMATSSSKVSIYEEISIDPSAGLRARKDDLDSLRSKLDKLVKAVVSNNLTLFGVRID